MQYIWLAIIGISLVPVAVAAFFANPLIFIVLGPEEWRSRAARLYRHRWWIAFSIVVCAFGTTVYGIRYS